MEQQKFLNIRFNPDRTFSADMLMDRYDALTVISALIRHFGLKPEEIELSNKLDKVLYK